MKRGEERRREEKRGGDRRIEERKIRQCGITSVRLIRIVEQMMYRIHMWIKYDMLDTEGYRIGWEG